MAAKKKGIHFAGIPRVPKGYIAFVVNTTYASEVRIVPRKGRKKTTKKTATKRRAKRGAKRK